MLRFLLIFCFEFVVTCHWLAAYNIQLHVRDSTTLLAIPFVKVMDVKTGNIVLTNVMGTVSVNSDMMYSIDHPMFEPRLLNTQYSDTIKVHYLQRKKEIHLTEDQMKLGSEVILKYHANLKRTSSQFLPNYDYLSQTNIDISHESSDRASPFVQDHNFYVLEKNQYRFPNKYYSRLVMSEWDNGDSVRIKYLPLAHATLNSENEYIKILDIKYFNPLYNSALRRYEYYVIDTIELNNEQISVIYFKTKEGKNFNAFTGLLYFTGEYAAQVAGYALPKHKVTTPFFLAYYLQKVKSDTRFMTNFTIQARLKHVPNLRGNSMMRIGSEYLMPVFTDDTSKQKDKWVSMALFDRSLSHTQNETWMMHQSINPDKLEYLKKDTTANGFVLENSMKLLINLYLNRLGYRTKYFDINNIFAINKFEAVRLGLGLQSHESLSDVFTFGGFFGYGIKDGKFKYGSNVGMHFGPSRRSLFSVEYKRDLQEPGLVNYLNKNDDLVRNFFSSRMDDRTLFGASLKSQVNPFFSTKLQLNSFELKPLYDYIYNPYSLEIQGPQVFNFLETSLLLNLGTPFSDNPMLRQLLYYDKKITSNVYLTISKGWDDREFGDYNYWKINSLINSNIKTGTVTSLDMVIDAGIMTKNMPYQINYGGPGTEFKLTGIIIKNAFQTMQLYGFFADRYLNSFFTYNSGNVFFENAKYRPELDFALNIGWGRIAGDKDIHEGIAVRDYPTGYYEAGVLLNNLLRLKIYKYLYGGLGIGTFVGYGPGAENGAFAIRLSYEIGVL